MYGFKFLLLLFIIFPVASTAQEICAYTPLGGKETIVDSKEKVPLQYRKLMKCGYNQKLAKPQDIVLDGNIRKESISTSIGRMEVRWPRKVELLFGRTPQRALAESASAVSKALKRGGFPSTIENLKVNWNVIFMDEDLPEAQIPFSLVSNCHPGWFTAPGNIYIVAQRVAAGCGGAQREKSVADSDLTLVLLHELGHGVENALLEGKGDRERMQAEGFATWFESYAASFSPIVDRKKREYERVIWAKQVLIKNDLNFKGSAEDYAAASYLFTAIANRGGIPNIMRIYSHIRETNHSFIQSVEEVLSWNKSKLMKEALDSVIKDEKRI